MGHSQELEMKRSAKSSLLDSSAGLRELRLHHTTVPCKKVLAALLDAHRAGSLAEELQAVGVMPTLAFTPGQVLASLDRDRFDLIVVHLHLAGPNPLAFFRAVRARTRADILGLVGYRLPRADEGALGINSHASDRLSSGLLAAKVAELVSQRPRLDVPGVLQWGALELDLSRRKASWCGDPLELTPMQLRILGVLVVARGAVVTTEDLSRLVWGTAVDDRSELQRTLGE
jgi:DNA-binding response OmpR family regulator